VNDGTLAGIDGACFTPNDTNLVGISILTALLLATRFAFALAKDSAGNMGTSLPTSAFRNFSLAS